MYKPKYISQNFKLIKMKTKVIMQLVRPKRVRVSVFTFIKKSQTKQKCHLKFVQGKISTM